MLRLSKRGMVAMAGRAARRVQPLFHSARGKDVQAVEQAIRLAEDFARAAITDAGTGASARAGTAADAAGRARDTGISDRAAADAADAASAAASVAADASAADATDVAAAAAAAVATAVAAADPHVADVAATADGIAAFYVGRDAVAAVVNAIWHDYDRLLRMSPFPADSDDLGVPMSCEAIGPLWLDGEPERFRCLREKHASEPIVPDEDDPLDGIQEPSELKPSGIEVFIDPGGASKETIQEVLESLSELYVAAGGAGLIFTMDGFYQLAAEEAGV
jgi:hypothetical protein